MANRFLIGAGGTWTVDGSWSTTDGGVADTVAPTASDDVFLTVNSGQCTISATGGVGKSLNCTGYTNTLTHGAFTLTISGSITLVSGMTYTPTDSASTVFTMIATGTLTTGGKLMQTISNSGNAGTMTLGDNLSFAASKLCVLALGTTGSFDMNGKTINGNSVTNRVMVRSSTVGTSRTITNATTSFTNANFRDIAFSSASNLNLSAISGLSGDAVGNTITGGGTVLTFTTAAPQTWDGSTGNASTSASWTSRTPLPQDNVIVSSGTVTFDMPQSGNSITFSGTGNGTFSVTTDVFGSMTLRSGMTFTQSATISFMNRTTSTITSAGNTFGSAVTMNVFGGTLSLLDAFSIPSVSSLTISSGTFDANDFNVTDGGQASVSTGATVNMGNGTWTLTRSSSTVWTGSGTVNSEGSTILISDTGASTKTFAGGGKVYNNLQISGGGAGAIIITGANIFNHIWVLGGTKSITLPGSTTTTIMDGSRGFGNLANLVTITASAGSTTVSMASGTFRGTSLSLTNIISTGGATFYAGLTPPSVDGTGNTGWIFLDAPGGSSQGTLMAGYSAGVPFNTVGLF